MATTTATRRLAAILAADVAGYSRLIGADEGGTLQALKAIRAELIDPTIAAHNGRQGPTGRPAGAARVMKVPQLPFTMRGNTVGSGMYSLPM
jgi:class 3 adenylate cyclase